MREYWCLHRGDNLTFEAESAVLRHFMDLRLRYVTAMGWLDGLTSDHDRYDADDGTWYFVRRNSEPDGTSVIASALRATQVTSVYESMTWSMLGTDARRQADIIAANLPLITEVNRDAARRRAGLWDITRLVSPMDGSVPAAEIIRSIHELLGMVTYQTVAEPDADPAWIFLTTPTIKRLIEISGIPCAVLFSGRVNPRDEEDAFLCIARPKHALDRIGHSAARAHRRAYDHVHAGFTASAARRAAPAVA